MKKSKSNIALWLLFLAALGGGAYFIIRKVKNKTGETKVVKRSTGLLVNNSQPTAQSNVSTSRQGALRKIKEYVKSNIQKS